MRIQIPILLLAGIATAGCSNTPPETARHVTKIQPAAASLQSAAQVQQRMPLSTKGRYIVDAAGNRFKLKSVNWYGASDTRQVVGGLDKQPIANIVGLIQEWGFNSVRLPFSNIMLHDTNPVP